MGTPGVKEKELENHAAKGPNADSSVIGTAECDKALDVSVLDHDHVKITGNSNCQIQPGLHRSN